MSVDGRNTISCGIVGEGVGLDPLEASLPYKSGILRGLQPLGGQVGLADMLTDNQLNNITMWKPDQQFTGSAAATPIALVNPTATDPLLLRVTGPTDGSDILGNTQLQSSNGAVGTALARFFARSGNLVHFLARARWNSSGGATLIGLTNVGTTLLAAAGTVSANITDGIYFYRAPGSTTITAFVRRGGANKQTQVITTTAAINTFYTLGFRVDAVGSCIFSLDGVEFSLTLASDGSDAPNAALALTIIQGGNARTLDLQRMFAAQEAI
jgi:hypothetical protein